MELFLELSFVIFIATIFSFIAKRLKQPLVIGYILTGIVSGPTLLNIFKSTEQLDIFIKIGISILLFIVGLNLNPKVIKEVGKTSVVTGILQVLVTSTIGYFLSRLLGLNHLSSLYVSIALTFSSTIIVLKLLSDKGDFHKLYGKITIGVLLVQDIIASIILLFVSSSTPSANINLLILSLIIKFLILLTIIFLFNTYILPSLTTFISSSSETLFLFSLAWGLGLGSIFYKLGFSLEIGSLIAGVSLSATPFAYEISSKLKPIRDFFIILFFITLGSQINTSEFFSLLPQAIIFSLFVLIGNPFIVIMIMNLLGHKRKTSFLSGLTVAQISEFSLILASLGFSLQHISQTTLSLITLIGLITISFSTYLILYSEPLYSKIENILKFLELKKNNHDKETQNQKYEILLFGYDRVGENFLPTFNKLKKSFLVIDLNPQAINKLNTQKIPNRFGDASDIDFLEELELQNIKLAISTIPNLETNLLILKELKLKNSNSTFITISHDAKEATELYKQGASFVAIPHHLGAKHIVHILTKFGYKHSSLRNERDKHLAFLNANDFSKPL